MEILKIDLKLYCLMFNITHDGCDTVSTIFRTYLSDLLLKFLEIYEKCSNSVNFWARKVFFFKTGQNFTRNWLVMFSVSYASKNAYSAGKTSGLLRGGASGTNRGYVLANCASPQKMKSKLKKKKNTILKAWALLGWLSVKLIELTFFKP